MKPKIVLAKYLDWAVLSVLAVALLVVGVRSFLLKTTGEEKLRDDINQAERIIQKWMTDTSAEPQKPPDYLADLRNRFEHPAVMDPYQHNPFLTREDIAHPSIDLRVGAPKEVKFKGTRFTQAVTLDEKRVRVDLAYDLPTGVSAVTFTALEPGLTTVRIQTDEDAVHLFQIRATTAKKPRAPNPPLQKSIQVVAHAAIQIKNTLRSPMVLISFMPDNPREQDTQIGSSSSAEVYRKPAGAPDADYVLLTKDKPLVPLAVAEIANITSEFRIPPWSPTAPATPAAPTAPAGPEVPDEAAHIRRPGPAVEESVEAEPPLGSFVFLDRTAHGGEWYTYKIVTLSAGSDVESVPCEKPCVTAPVYAGRLVEFDVQTISTEQADIHARRRDPDTGEWLPSQNFTVGIGMKIGGKVSIKQSPLPSGLPRPPKEVDFSTGCILVNTLQGFQTVEYGKLSTARAGAIYGMNYQAKYARVPQILYLTPDGDLKLEPRKPQSRTSP